MPDEWGANNDGGGWFATRSEEISSKKELFCESQTMVTLSKRRRSQRLSLDSKDLFCPTYAHPLSETDPGRLTGRRISLFRNLRSISFRLSSLSQLWLFLGSGRAHACPIHVKERAKSERRSRERRTANEKIAKIARNRKIPIDYRVL